MSYEVGDKVVVKIDKDDTSHLNDEIDMFPAYEQVLGKLEDFQPKQEKIKFTPEMKKELDLLKAQFFDVYRAMDAISSNRSKYSNLSKRLLCGKNRVEDDKHQYLFSLAWHNQSLIGVVELERHQIKVGSQKMYINGNGEFMFAITGKNTFTLDEVKEAEKQLGIQGLQDKWHEAKKENK